QAMAHAEIVLRIKSQELVAVVFKFSPALAKALNPAQEKAGHSIVGDVGGELDGGAAEKLVVQIHSADFGVRPESEAVPALHPMQIVGKGVIGPREPRRRVVGELEKAA